MTRTVQPLSNPRPLPLIQRLFAALGLLVLPLLVLPLLMLLAGCTTATPPDAVLAVPAPPQKYAAIVVDARTGKPLFEVNSTA